MLGQYDKAKELFERALKIQEQHHDQDHFQLAKMLTKPGNVFGRLGDQSKKKELLERAFDVFVKHYGHGSVEVAITIYNLALAHGELGEYQKAAELPVFQRSLWSAL